MKAHAEAGIMSVKMLLLHIKDPVKDRYINMGQSRSRLFVGRKWNF